MQQGTPAACGSAMVRAGGALALLKMYRTGLLLGADLADERAVQARAQYGPGDPVAAVLQELARTNRAAKAGLDEFAAALDAHFLAQLHGAAMCVVGATASYAGHADNFARKFVHRSRQEFPPWPHTSPPGSPMPHPHSFASPPRSNPLVAVQLVHFWRTSLLYCKLAFCGTY